MAVSSASKMRDLLECTDKKNCMPGMYYSRLRHLAKKQKSKTPVSYRIGSLVSYRLVSDRLVSVGSSRLGRDRDASVRLPRERRETPDTRTKSCRPGQAARGWRQLVIAAEHRRRGLRCWLSPRRRFHVSPAQSGAETSRKCASSQLLMDLRREPSPPSSSTAGPARPSGASFKRAV